MAKFQLTEYQVHDLYLNRPPLEVEGYGVVRMRVALRSITMLWNKWPHKVPGIPFATYVLQRLDKMRASGKPHPLNWELVTIAKRLAEGGSRSECYVMMLDIRAKRAIHKVRYGGRR